ncbi:MAG: response regulator transcription factor [Cyclobacteriaceae bacterium]|nr:response regulator transcription factor [Cyclobacteriaceae bacterium]
MKKHVLIATGIIATSIFLLSAGSIITRPSTSLPEKELAIALRNVGHQLLLHAGDSTSRVLPVKQVDAGTYSLAFQSPFAFVPDSLVRIVQKSLVATAVPLNYTVNVLECATQQIVYGFQIGEREQTTLVPCLGREQPMGCYTIMLSFLQRDGAVGQRKFSFALAAVSLAFMAFVGRAFSKKKIKTTEAAAIRIGQYEFYETTRVLKIGKVATDLSDKEAQLLKLFSKQCNQPVARELLMRDVWQDNGALVSRSLDVFVSRLRKKLKADPTIQILNVHGVGYKLVVRSSE